MELNLKNFDNVLKKATLNFNIPSVKLIVDKDRVKSGMTTISKNVVIFLNLPNNVLTPLTDDIELKFYEPQLNIRPYLKLVDDETIPAKIENDKLVLKSDSFQSNLFFCARNNIISSIDFSKDPKLTPFFESPLNENLIGYLNKIVKISTRFERIYFAISGNKLTVEATDKTLGSNSVKFKLADVNFKDFELAFDSKNFVAIMSLITDEAPEEFKIKIIHKENKTGDVAEGAIILFEKNDSSEKYYLMSQTPTQPKQE